ncbi:MAG TPA: hypothetical protein VNM40_01160 [Candidatus Paceibacterota bacterium]|nr:hypothetical protein [Candidatus Paceibacterota bacterium]
MKRTAKKILLFAQDGSGIGHLRRLSRIAEHLQASHTTLLVTGKREAAYMLPPQCEFIHIPSWRSMGHGPHAREETRWRDMSARDAIVFISALCERIHDTFQPECIIADYLPFGMFDELRGLLKRTGARKYLVERGIFDSHDTHRFTASVLDEVRSTYDAVLFASDARISKESGGAFTQSLGTRVKHIGYIMPPAVDRMAVRKAHAVPNGPWIVCSAGGGMKAGQFLAECARAAMAFSDAFFDIVLGPYAAEDAQSFDAAPNCRIRRTQWDLPRMHAASDIAIINGGYNSLLEAVSGGARVIVFPNQQRVGEQVMHAKQLAEFYPISVLADSSGLSAAITQNMRSLESRPTFALDTAGLETLQKEIES